MAKVTTYADKAKAIHKKYYSNRKPGEDNMTDEAFNREMEELMMRQESVKSMMAPDNSQFANQEFAKGGGLPMYDGFGESYLTRADDRDWLLNKNRPTKLTVNKRFPEITEEQDNYQYSPTANILGPALQTGANFIASKLAANNADKRRKELLKTVNLGRLTPQQIDLGRERADIRANAALSDATGRYVAKGARSASEAANIANAARIASQRIAGSQTGQSLQREQTTNAQLRGDADKYNKQLQAQEAEMKLAIEQRYGDMAPQIWADFAQKTGQTIGNYMAENQKMRSDAEYLEAVAPWHEIQYDTDGKNRFLMNTGITRPRRRVSVKPQYLKP